MEKDSFFSENEGGKEKDEEKKNSEVEELEKEEKREEEMIPGEISKGEGKEEKERETKEEAAEKGSGEQQIALKGEDRLGVFCDKRMRFIFKESVLKDGEEFYGVKKVVKSKVDKFKGRVFVRLKNSEEGCEVWKCVLCMEVFSKEESMKGGKRQKDKKVGEEKKGEEKEDRPSAYKLGFFYRHLVDKHGDYVRRVKVEEIPADGDCVSMIRNYFVENEIKVGEEVMSVLEERKRK